MHCPFTMHMNKVEGFTVDEAHANPLAAWIAMGAPDYTTAAQNAALLTASELVVEKLADIATVGYGKFTITVPTHGVAAVRIAARGGFSVDGECTGRAETFRNNTSTDATNRSQRCK